MTRVQSERTLRRKAAAERWQVDFAAFPAWLRPPAPIAFSSTVTRRTVLLSAMMAPLESWEEKK